MDRSSQAQMRRRTLPSLQRTIFRRVLAFTLSLIVVLLIVFATVSYAVSEQQEEHALMLQAQSLAEELNAVGEADQLRIVQEQRYADLRISLIDAEGRVRFDSKPEAYGVNHGDRPEVMRAKETGEAALVRQSATIDHQLVYAAVLLHDGSVLRLAMERQSMTGFMGSLALPFLAVAALIALIVFFVSRGLARHILEPIDRIDVSHPLDNEIYEEMEPLLISIDRQQARLKRQNEELARADSFRREFSSNVSHELKTPLQVIAGYAELIKNGLLDLDDLPRIAGIISDEAQSMRAIIDDVMILSRLDESALDESTCSLVDLRTVAERVLARLAPLAKAREVTLCFEGGDLQIWGNETLLEMMVYNLVENAIRYNLAGGSVALLVKKIPEATRMGERAVEDSESADGAEEVQDRVSASSESSEHVLIEVKDTGIGIPSTDLDKVFERFYRVEKSRSKETGGSGLGLAIVKHAASYHHGSVEVTSEPGRGTSFFVKLPRGNEQDDLVR